MAGWRQVVQNNAKAADKLSIRPTAQTLHNDLALLCGKGMTTKRHSSVKRPKER